MYKWKTDLHIKACDVHLEKLVERVFEVLLPRSTVPI